jgi:DUF4097 and DUF4098 domain-containing protein YvlB
MRNKGLWIVVLVIAMIGVCMVCAIVGFFSFRTSSTVNLGTVGNVLNDRIFQNDSYMAEADETMQILVAEDAITLVVENTNGNVDIRGVDIDQVNLKAHITAWGSSETNAEENLERIDYEVIETSEKITIRVNNPTNENMGFGQVDLHLEVPLDTKLKVTGSSGRLYAAQIQGSVDFNNDFGNIELSDIQGGPVVVTTENGYIEMNKILISGNNLKVTSEFGDLKLVQISAKELTATTRNGMLGLEEINVSGPTKLASDFGEIAVEGGKTGSLEVQSQNGSIVLKELNMPGELIAHTDFGNLKLKEVFASNYDLESKNGLLELDGANQAQIKAVTDFGDITIINVKSGVINLETKNGIVTFRGSLADEEHMVRSDFGNITLRFPSNQTLNLDLNTGFGMIKSEFDFTVSGTVQEKHWVGKINAGGGLLTVETENGSITLEKSVAEE